MNEIETTAKIPSVDFDGKLPLERASTVPSSWYFDSAVYLLERERVFGRSWLAVGRVDQVSKPGDFFTIDVAGEPMVVVRDEAGVLRAFSNVCRHRAARVAVGDCGSATKFRCRYHGWTYDLQGRLKGVPESDGICDFAREDNGLPALRVEVWGPLVFVAFDDSAGDFAEFVQPLTDRVDAAELAGLKFVERRSYDIACNWKVYVDNYLDGGYHVNTIHPALAGVLDYSKYRTEIHGQTNVQLSPLKPPDAKTPDAVIGVVRTGNWAQYWWLFPNFMLNLYSGVMDTNLVLPLGVDRCRVIFDFYFAKTETAEDRKFIAESIRVADQVQVEDIEISEDVQRGLGSQSYSTGRFMPRRESGGYHFHRLLAQKIQTA